MKLTYRGIEYDYNPPMLEVTESKIACRYRGQVARYTYVRHVPIPQPAERLTYRGVAYQTTRYGQVQQLTGQQLTEQQPTEQQLTEQPTRQGALSGLRSKLVGVSPAIKVRRELLQEASQHHKENIVRSLQHRIEVAKAQGNDILLQQLESEMHQSV